MLRAAIIGLGGWGQTLVNSIQTDGAPKGDRIRVTRAVTRTPDKVRDYAAQQNMPVSADYSDALSDPAIDAVILTTPNTQHAEQVIQAAQAGKHVFVDKPFTMDKPSAEAAAAACAKAGVVLAVGHNRRFLPSVHELKRLIASGALGELLQVEGHFTGPFAIGYPPDRWRATRAESPAGGMTAMGIHTVDTMIDICGRIRDVQAISQRRALDIDIDDTTSALLRFESGIHGYLTTLCATARLWRIQVFGTKGWVCLRDQQTMEIRMLGEDPTGRTFEFVDIERAELEAFARAALGGPAYPLPVPEAVHGIAVQDAIVASAERDGVRVVVV